MTENRYDLPASQTESKVPKAESQKLEDFPGHPAPNVDVAKIAIECKVLLNVEKFNMIDPGIPEVEAWPDPTDPAFPEITMFSAQMEEFFEWADTLTIGDKGEGYPSVVRALYDAKQAEIEKIVNADEEFWDVLRSEVLPIYGGIKVSKDANGELSFKENPLPVEWRNRWKSIKIVYDPFGMEVDTIQKEYNPKTKKIESLGIVRTKHIPPGFVIKVN